jgi:hypothetical protein
VEEEEEEGGDRSVGKGGPGPFLEAVPFLCLFSQSCFLLWGRLGVGDREPHSSSRTLHGFAGDFWSKTGTWRCINGSSVRAVLYEMCN